MRSGERADQPVLGVVRVLVLVDENVLERALPLLAGLGDLLEQVRRVDEEIVEVHRAGLEQTRLVAGVDLAHERVEVAVVLVDELLRRQQLVLGGADARVHAAGRVALGILAQVVLNDRAHEPNLVRGVVDRERRAEPDARGVGPQNACAGGVEGHHPHPGRVAPEQPVDALRHLPRGLVGEGDRQNRARRGAALLHEMRDSVRQHPGFAGTRAGDDQQRARIGLDGL